MIDSVAELQEHDFTLCPHADLNVEEKRCFPRFPWSAEMTLTLLPALEAADQPEQVFEGETKDIAKGGIGMLCNRPLTPGTAVRCEIALSHHAVPIPTLLRVRWTALMEDKKRYRVGLQFLF